MQLHIIHVCRRFGPVGGMERYVWELTRELASLGHSVEVLCEKNLCTEPLDGVAIHVLEKVPAKPRWLGYLIFSRRVHTWLIQHPIDRRIIHSHERTQDHHITTFHGPPFATVHELPLWKRLSLRVKMNIWLEKRELYGRQVQKIIPNSFYTQQQLQHYYPKIKPLLTVPITPGVSPCEKRPARLVLNQKGVVGFIGKEWKRKGLQKAIDILSELFKTRKELTFLVAGPCPQDIQALFKHVPFNFQLLGEVETANFYPQLDVLLHPASKEPYGMVITEALASAVPVVISNACGAAMEIHDKIGSVLSLEDDIQHWSHALDSWLNNANQNISFHRTWKLIAKEHEAIYATIQHQQPNPPSL